MFPSPVKLRGNSQEGHCNGLFFTKYDSVEVIGGSDDKGIDIVCEKWEGLIKTRIGIQCKCKSLKKKIGPKDISTLRDNLSTQQCQHGIFITTTYLNPDAKAKAKEAGKIPIFFIEHDEIFELFAEHQIGIKHEDIRYYQLDSSVYDFLE